MSYLHDTAGGATGDEYFTSESECKREDAESIAEGETESVDGKTCRRVRMGLSESIEASIENGRRITLVFQGGYDAKVSTAAEAK